MIANIIRNAKKYSATGDPYYSAVSLMLSMDGTDGSTTFTDSGPNALAVTATSVTISTTQSKYGGASASFNGTSSSLDVAAGITLGTSDFTLEGWIYLTSLPPNTIFNAGTIIDLRNTDTNDSMFFGITPSGSIYIYVINGNKIQSANGAIAINTWYHVAVVRKNSSTAMYLNGTQVSSSWADTTNYPAVTGRSFRIGKSVFVGYPSYLNGYIDDFRISRFARYVSNFTPPTAALPTTASSTVADPYYNYTSLLLHMDGANASTNFADSGPSALTVTAVGNAQISTSQSKYGGASGYFDGSGDYVSIPSSSLFAFGSGDFTIEFWLKTTDTAGGLLNLTGGTTGYWQLSLYNGSLYWQTTRDTTNLHIISATSVLDGAWHHIAVTRQGTTNRVYFDGSQAASATDSTNYSGSGGSLFIGRDSAGSDLNAYIDDLRITKYARYTSAFTPPAAALPDIYNPNTTLPVTGAALWLDASQQNTLFTDAGTTPVTTSGQSVYQWNDLSGNNRHAIQATSGNRPTWVPPASGQNGLGAVKILGATSNQSLSATVPASIWNNPFSVFFVFVNTATNSSKDVFIQGAAGTGGYRSVWISNASPSKVAWSQFASVLNMANTANPQAYAISLSSDAQSTSAINAITNSTSYSGTVSHISISSNTLYLGGLGTPADYTLCEMAIFPSQLTSGQLTSLNNYAKAKWGTP